MVSLRRISLILTALVLLTIFYVQSFAVSGTLITNAYMPCAKGVSGNITTIHNTYAPDVPAIVRRSLDIRCGVTGGSNGTDRRIFAPVSGVVYKVNNGADTNARHVFIDDYANNACLVMWHMTPRVSVGQNITVGTRVGTATGVGNHVHIAWIDMSCAQTGGNYSKNRMSKERPISLIEVGYELPHNIRVRDMGNYVYTSQNPTDGVVITPTPIPVQCNPPFASDGLSTIAITVPEVILTMRAANLPGCMIYATLYRDAANGYPAKIWRYQINATGNSVTFTNMEGAGDTFAGVRYYTVVSLAPISDADAAAKRTACANATGYRQFCDSVMR